MKQRDIELLSSYLDGQLSSANSARLEARLRTDPELRSVLQDLRGARSLLRQLPMRKAPRNFTLTPKMVGKNPPLPRSYPVFKFSATLATILLFFTMGLNVLRPQLAAQPAGFGMGGGGAPDITLEISGRHRGPSGSGRTGNRGACRRAIHPYGSSVHGDRCRGGGQFHPGHGDSRLQAVGSGICRRSKQRPGPAASAGSR